MTFIVVLAIYFVALFLVVFTSRRLSAMASLAICAGAVLARLWSNELTPLVAQAGINLTAPPLGSLVAIVLTLLPAFLVLAKSPKTHAKHHKVFGSIVFAVLGVMLTYGAFSNAVILDEQSKKIVLQVLQYEKWIITVAIVLAIGEVLAFHKPQHHQEQRKR